MHVTDRAVICSGGVHSTLQHHALYRTMLDLSVRKKLEELRRKLGEKEKLLVAFSGGVDSGLLLHVAHDVLGQKRVLAVTITSALFPQRELEPVKHFVTRAGIPHKIVELPWQQNEDFVNNPRNRCYYCKRDYANLLKAIAAEAGITTIAEGVTVSDFDEYRPGLFAAREAALWHPLAEVGLTKQEVRQIAQEIGLPFWDKPSSPCLATRIEYGERLTKAKLAMIEAAENYLQDLGFKQLRVRLHRGGLARIEVAQDELDVFGDFDVLQKVSMKLKALGFAYVTLDLEGYRSGSMDTAR
jgi:uncharacterized protein